jgi:hypothetical protein
MIAAAPEVGAQMSHVDMYCVLDGTGCSGGPKSVRELPAVDGLAGMKGEESEQRSTLPSMDLDEAVVNANLERPKQTKLQRVRGRGHVLSL